MFICLEKNLLVTGKCLDLTRVTIAMEKLSSLYKLKTVIVKDHFSIQ